MKIMIYIFHKLDSNVGWCLCSSSSNICLITLAVWGPRVAVIQWTKLENIRLCPKRKWMLLAQSSISEVRRDF